MEETKTTAPKGNVAYGRAHAREKLSVRKDDLHESPEEAVAALLGVEDVPKVIWETSCGPGAIVHALRASGRTVIATDLVDYGCPDSESRIDFLMEHKPPPGVEGIVMNPPYKLADEFIMHSRILVPKTYALLRLAYLEGERRRKKLFSQGDLARVWVFSRRLPRMHRAGYEGKKSSSRLAFAWFVWDRAHKGPPNMGFLDYKEHVK